MFAENAAKKGVHRYGTSNCISHTHQLLKDKPASGTKPLMFSLFWRFNPRAPRVRDEEKPKNRCSETACCGLNRRLMSFPVTLDESLCVEVGSLNRCLTQNQVIIVSSIQWNYCSKKNSFEHSCASPWSKDHVKTHGETNQIQVEMRHPRTLEPHRYLDSLLVLESSTNQFLWSSYPVCGSPNTLIHKVIHSSVGHYFKTDLIETDLCPTEWDFCGKLQSGPCDWYQKRKCCVLWRFPMFGLPLASFLKGT